MKIICNDRRLLFFDKNRFSIKNYGLLNRYLQTMFICADDIKFRPSLYVTVLFSNSNSDIKWEVFVFGSGDLHRIDGKGIFRYITIPLDYKEKIRKFIGRIVEKDSK